MYAMVGRARELSSLRTALVRARTVPVPTTIRIVGASGIGKTSLLTELSHSAEADGWLVVCSACHRIQIGTPFLLLRRTVRVLYDALHGRRERYRSGLESAIAAIETPSAPDADAVREKTGATIALLHRLLEGVTLDIPVLLAVDDAQWIDAESCNALLRALPAFSDRPIALLFSERDDELGGHTIDADTTISLGTLTLAASSELVTDAYPGAPQAVVNAITEYAVGRPIELRTLAEAAREQGATTPADVAVTFSGAIAREIKALAPAQREFLHLCSLIAEPIEHQLLATLIPDDVTRLACIEMSMPRYLVRDGSALRFTHAAIAEGIRQTLTIEIPYRKRIINALLALDHLKLDDRERIVEQALACGEVGMAREALLALAAAAEETGALSTAIRAYESALRISEPQADEALAFYQRYIAILFAANRLEDARNALERVLRVESTHAVSAPGGLVAYFLLTLWMLGDRAHAMETYARLSAELTSERDLAELHSAALWIYANDLNPEAFAATRTLLEGSPSELSSLVLTRLHSYSALFDVRMDRDANVEKTLANARRYAREVSTVVEGVVETLAACTTFLRYGPASAMKAFERNLKTSPPVGNDAPMVEFYTSICDLSQGRFQAAQRRIEKALEDAMDSNDRLRLLGVNAAICAITGKRDGWQHTDEVLRLQELRTDSALLATGFFACMQEIDDVRQQQKNLQALLNYYACPWPFYTFYVPLAIVLAAHRRGDREILEELATPSRLWCDATPWNQAQRTLALGASQRAIGHADAQTHLRTAAQAFTRLDASFFTALARAIAGEASAQDAALLTDCACDLDELRDFPLASGRKRSRSSGKPRLSAREYEVSSLMVAGLSNREIATQLVLSERTVEAHLSNAYTKAGVSSRTQLAHWLRDGELG
ncbi:MAG: AAA family ATPase [Bacillati bacterium]